MCRCVPLCAAVCRYVPLCAAVYRYVPLRAAACHCVPLCACVPVPMHMRMSAFLCFNVGCGTVRPSPVQVVSAVLQYVQDEGVRQQVLTGTHSMDVRNVPVLNELVARRTALAKVVGFPAFPDYAARTRVEPDPKVGQKYRHRVL
jgi:hypothetical protein